MNKWIVGGLMVVIVFLGLQLSITAQSLQTVRTILNNVWDKANHRLMTTPGVGAQGMIETEQTIFNDVWDNANNMLRVSGGGGTFEQYTEATLPTTCTPYTYVTVIDSTVGSLYMCVDSGDGWVPATPTVTPTSTVNTLPWRPVHVDYVDDFTFSEVATWYNVDTTAEEITGVLPVLSDASKPGFYTAQITAGVNCLVLTATAPNIFRGVGTGVYPSICGLRTGADVWRCSSNEWCVRAMTVPSKKMMQWNVVAGKLPASNGPEVDQSTVRASLLFDATTKECLSYQAEVPSDYLGNLEAVVKATMKTDTTTNHTLGWGVSIWATRDGLAESVLTEGYDTEVECAVTAIPGVVERTFTCRVVMTALDGLAVGDNFVARLCRIVAAKTTTGDARVIGFGFMYDWR